MNEKPTRPDQSECCGSGCKPCIFDVYEEKLKKWEQKKTDIQSKGLNQIKYLPFLIVDIVNMTNSLKIFKFQAVILKKENHDRVLIENVSDYEILQDYLNIKAGEFLIMKGISDNESVISRSYTPIISKADFETGAFTVIISLQPHGKMSQFLAGLKIKDIVFWRGPYEEFVYCPNSHKHILLIGGGAGVVPLYNIAKSIVENENEDTWVNVLVSFKTTESIVLRKEFGGLRDYWNFKITIFISDVDDFDFQSNYKESVLFKRIDKTVIHDEIKKYGDDDVFVVVCGPNGFNLFVKDNLRELGIMENNIFIFWYLMFYFCLKKS